MSKIINIARVISTTKSLIAKKLQFKLHNGFSQNIDKQAKTIYENANNEKSEKSSF